MTVGKKGLSLLPLALVAAGIAPAAAGADDLETGVAAMAKIGSCFSPSFSPDGRRIAFVSNLTGVPQVFTVGSAGGWPDQVTALDDPVGSVSWSPDGSRLAFTLAPGGGMNEQVYLVSPDGAGLSRITAGGKETNRLGPWTRDSRALALGSNVRDGAAIDAYLYDFESRRTRLVVQNRGVGGFSDLTRDKRHGLLGRLVSRGDDNLYLVDLATGKETLLTPHEGPGSFSGAFSPDGRAVYLAENSGRDLRAFARVSLAGASGPGSIEVLASRDDAELSGFELNDSGTRAALLWNAAGRSELAIFDLASRKTVARPKLPGDIAGGLEFSRDGRLLAMAVSGAAAPADIWVLDVALETFRQVTHSPHAGVDLARLARPELVTFRAHDGLSLSGWLYRPSGTAPFPTVLSFHGGPEGQERPSFNSTYQALLSRGIAVFAPNVRGSSGFGKKFVNLDNGPLRKNGVRDIESCVEAVVKTGVADARRIGIMGGSYGGYMVMAGLAEFPKLFAAGADLFGVVNFETFFKHTEPWMAAISKIEYGDPDTEAEMLRDLSPIHKVDRVTAPTIVLHGANDTNVPVVEAEQVVESLKKRGIPVEYVLFPDEGHGFRKAPNRIRSAVSIVRWFEKYLKAEPRQAAAN
jgi:dipeptidyl aminopeptidase/acylaminoacyl peptidase